MQVSFILLFNLLFSFTCYPQSWNVISDFPGTQRDDGVVFSIGSKFYCGTGLEIGWNPTRDMYVFDATIDTWIDTIYLPIGRERQYAVAFPEGTSGFVFGGIKGSQVLNDLWCYNSVNDQWSLKSSIPAAGRWGASCFSILNNAYIIGGMDSAGNILNEVWRYNMQNDQWLQMNDFSFGGRWRASSCSINNKGYLIFGKDNFSNIRNELYEYNLQGDSWSLVSSFPNNGRTYSSLVAYDNTLGIVFGVDSFNTCYNDLLIYDFGSGTWISRASMPFAARKGGLSFNYGSTIYYTTGIDQQDNRLKQTVKATDILSINQLEKVEVSIYPNPASHFIAVQGLNSSSSISIFNINGELVHTELTKNNTTGIKINIENLISGLYIVEVKDGASTYHTKLLIMDFY